MATIASTYNPQVLSSRKKLWNGREDGRTVARKDASGEKAASAPPAGFSWVGPRVILFHSLNTVHQTLRWSLLAAAGLFLVLFGLQFPHAGELDRARLIGLFHRAGDPLVVMALVWLRSWWSEFPFAGYLPLAFGLAGLLVRSGVTMLFVSVLEPLRPRVDTPVPQATSAPVYFFPDREADAETAVASERDRGQLLKRYREIESALQHAQRRRCAFLSIDVAGSTRMKENERELPVAVTFQAYMNMLEEIFTQHSAWKMSWTPDGVMVCFLDANLAAAAARTVLQRLRAFNRTENLLRSRISVRCGLHEGEVPIFEDSKLEKVAHQVLDVTGHLQKHASPDTLWVSADVVAHLEDKAGLQVVPSQVDGHQVYEWSPRLTPPDRPPVYVPPPQLAGNSDPTWV